MTRFREAVVCCIALGGLTLPALADSPVTVVGRPDPGMVVPMHSPAPDYQLIQISNMNRHAVGLMMNEDVVAPEVIQLQMGNQGIFVDPDRKYMRQTGGIDDAHSILRAQRTYKALTAQKYAYVIRRGELEPMAEDNIIVPRAILLRPDYMERRAPQQPMMPAPVPASPKVEQGPVASAE